VSTSTKFLKGTVDLRITDIQKDLKATNGEIYDLKDFFPFLSFSFLFFPFFLIFFCFIAFVLSLVPCLL
jgi:hypothetical protein